MFVFARSGFRGESTFVKELKSDALSVIFSSETASSGGKAFHHVISESHYVIVRKNLQVYVWEIFQFVANVRWCTLFLCATLGYTSYVTYVYVSHKGQFILKKRLKI